MRGPALDVEHNRRALDQARAEHRMFQIGLGLRQARDRVPFRSRAAAEPRELREHVPHPMRALATIAELGERAFVRRGLRFDEAVQVVLVVDR